MNTTETILKKICFLDKMIIQHAALTKAVKGINLAVEKTQYYRESFNCVIVATGGMGKTTICRQILATSQPTTIVEDHVERRIIPSFYAQIPSPTTIKSVASRLLKALGDPNPHAGTTDQMTDRLCILLTVCETRLVLLDEFHHLLDVTKTSTKLNLKIANWIKELVNTTEVSFCLLGLPDFEPVLRADSQLARRFPMVYALDRLKLGNSGDGELIAFLAEVQRKIKKHLAIENMPCLTTKSFATQLYAATAGTPSFVMSLIKESLFIGLSDSSANNLSLDDFAAAWDTGITNTVSLVKSNPFRMSAGQLASHMREGEYV